MAALVRRRIGEEYWAQGGMFLGHRNATISDLYTLFDIANLGRELASVEEIIAEIE